MAFWARWLLCLCYCLLSWDAAADDEIDDGDDDEGKDGDDVDDADGYKGQQGGCRARSLWQYGLPMHRLNILNLPALKMMIPVRILMVLIMKMVLRMMIMVMILRMIIVKILRMMIMVMGKLVSRSIVKPGVNISHILLRLNDRENAEK